MGDFDGEGLFILAAIVIAFINWLSNTLKRKAAKKELERRRARGELVEPEGAAEAGPDEGDWPEPDIDIPVVVQGGASAQLRHFFESLNKTAETEPPPPPPEPQPAVARRRAPEVPRPSPVVPPVSPAQEAPSWKPKQVKRTRLSEQERHALERLEQSKGLTPKRAKTHGTHPIIAKLHQHGGAREAIILSEILGKPKALAESDRP